MHHSDLNRGTVLRIRAKSLGQIPASLRRHISPEEAGWLSARGLLRLIRPKKSPLPTEREGGRERTRLIGKQLAGRTTAREKGTTNDEAVKRFVYHTPGIFASVNVLSVRVCGTTLTPPLPPFSAARVSKQ